MGTHPIFESDFDCLTGMEILKVENLSESCAKLVDEIDENVTESCLKFDKKYRVEFAKSGKKSNQLAERFKKSGNEHYKAKRFESALKDYTRGLRFGTGSIVADLYSNRSVCVKAFGRI